MPRDAEAWLAERGVPRDPIRVAPPPPAEPSAAPAPGAPGATGAGLADGPAGGTSGTPAAEEPRAAIGEVTGREAARLAAQAAADAAARAGDASALPDPTARRLEDDVAEALAFVRRSTAGAPQPEARLRGKLADRDVPQAVIDAAMDRARRERLVDDDAMAAALVEERRAKGHAPARIRRDLRARGFDDATLERHLAAAEAEDPEAAAFAVAKDRAARLTGETAETAFRRVASHVARRGYPDGLARKVAREAVFAARDPERTAGH